MTEASTAPKPTPDANATGPAIAAVRYQIKDVDRAIKFYTEMLGFKLERKAGTAFAMISRGPLQLVLSGPGSSGARPMPDGRRQEPGGWNRIIIYVASLDAEIEKLKGAGAHFRNEVEVGPGGRQIQVEDPDGNPIELHEGGAGAVK
jgi:catechol 2,3-dioxygenase-like lactoylglutathione lyase family enzyme